MCSSCASENHVFSKQSDSTFLFCKHFFCIFSIFIVSCSGCLLGMPQAFAGRTVTVTANPLWTDTGIVVNGRTFVIYGASGTWCFGSDLCCDANGRSLPYFSYDQWISGDNHGALIGYVGNGDPNDMPRITPQNDASLFFIGTGTVEICGRTGHLWLGINDSYTDAQLGVADNSGSLTVLIDGNSNFTEMAPVSLLLLDAAPQ